jgi:very-short-patch-repair endonuclease
MSVSEKRLWAILRDRRIGFKFRRQHPLGDYVLDFYCAEAKLNIETDGEQHQNTKLSDRLRDRQIAEHGILTLRIPTKDLFDLQALIENKWFERIIALCEERSGKKGHDFW